MFSQKTDIEGPLTDHLFEGDMIIPRDRTPGIEAIKNQSNNIFAKLCTPLAGFGKRIQDTLLLPRIAAKINFTACSV